MRRIEVTTSEDFEKAKTLFREYAQWLNIDLGFQDFEKDLFFLEKAGSSFLDAILPIIKKYKDYPYNEENKSLQNILRGHYVEFNLIYDRGTKFGFLSGGNPEAILCSMPPLASW
jgi:coproporphyrinogen III oxidase